MYKKKWFKKGVMKKAPYKLGWKKTQVMSTRRRMALESRPSNWTMKHRYKSAGQALMSLANVTKDKQTKYLAKRDAHYFYKKLK
jgi:hypothetical protein